MGITSTEAYIRSWRSDSAPDGNHRFLSWHNNTCAIGSMICALPHILVEAHVNNLFEQPSPGTPERALTCPAAVIIAALHFCNVSNMEAQETFSDHVRVLCLDMRDLYRSQGLVTWSPTDPDQDFICVVDVMADLFPAMLSARGGTFEPLINITTVPVRVCEILQRKKDETMAKFLQSLCNRRDFKGHHVWSAGLYVF